MTTKNITKSSVIEEVRYMKHRNDVAKVFLLTGKLLESKMDISSIQSAVQAIFPRHTEVGDAVVFDLDSLLRRLESMMDGEEMEFSSTDLYKSKDK